MTNGAATRLTHRAYPTLHTYFGDTPLEAGGKPGPNAAERALLDEVEDLKAALGEAHIELRVWMKSAEYRLGPSRT